MFIGQEGAIRTTHPLLMEWDTVGGNAFLQLNGLADDIRLLRGKLGLETVLTDIRDERLCLPSWHLLHTAALFERAQARSVVEFLEGGEAERPDAIVEVGGVRMPLEAKLLTRSEDEEHFGRVARAIEDGVTATYSRLKQSTALYIVLNAVALRFYACFRHKCPLKESIAAYAGASLIRRGDLCNVFLKP